MVWKAKSSLQGRFPCTINLSFIRPKLWCPNQIFDCIFNSWYALPTQSNIKMDMWRHLFHFVEPTKILHQHSKYKSCNSTREIEIPNIFQWCTGICKRCNSLLGNTAWTTVTIATMYTCLPYTYTVYFEHNVAQMGQWIHMYSPTCHMMQWDRTDSGISWVGAQVRQWIPMDPHMG